MGNAASVARGKALLEATATGNVEEAAAIISATPEATFYQGLKGGRSALALAAEKGDASLLRVIYEAAKATRGKAVAKECLNFCSPKGLTPLMQACIHGTPRHVECVAFLLNHGADALAVGPGGETALHLAARHGHASCLRQLLGARVPAAPGTPAQRLGDALVDGPGGRARLVDVRNEAGLSPLHLAALKGSAMSMAALLCAGAALGAATAAPIASPQLARGSTALHIAAARGAAPAAALLLEFQAFVPGVELRNVRNSHGVRAAQLARMAGHVGLAHMLSRPRARPRAWAPGAAAPRPRRRPGTVSQDALLAALAQRAGLLLSLRSIALDEAAPERPEQGGELSAAVAEVIALVRTPGALAPDGTLLERLVAAGARLPSLNAPDAAPATGERRPADVAPGSTDAVPPALAEPAPAAARSGAPSSSAAAEGAAVTSFLREHLRAAVSDGGASEASAKPREPATAPAGASSAERASAAQMTTPAECSLGTPGFGSGAGAGAARSAAQLRQSNARGAEVAAAAAMAGGEETGAGRAGSTAPSSVAAGALVQAALNAMAAAQPGTRPPEVLPANIWPTTPQAAALVVQAALRALSTSRHTARLVASAGPAAGAGAGVRAQLRPRTSLPAPARAPEPTTPQSAPSRPHGHATSGPNDGPARRPQRTVSEPARSNAAASASTAEGPSSPAPAVPAAKPGLGEWAADKSARGRSIKLLGSALGLGPVAGGPLQPRPSRCQVQPAVTEAPPAAMSLVPCSCPATPQTEIVPEPDPSPEIEAPAAAPHGVTGGRPPVRRVLQLLEPPRELSLPASPGSDSEAVMEGTDRHSVSDVGPASGPQPPGGPPTALPQQGARWLWRAPSAAGRPSRKGVLEAAFQSDAMGAPCARSGEAQPCRLWLCPPWSSTTTPLLARQGDMQLVSEAPQPASQPSTDGRPRRCSESSSRASADGRPPPVPRAGASSPRGPAPPRRPALLRCRSDCRPPRSPACSPEAIHTTSLRLAVGPPGAASLPYPRALLGATPRKDCSLQPSAEASSKVHLPVPDTALPGAMPLASKLSTRADSLPAFIKRSPEELRALFEAGAFRPRPDQDLAPASVNVRAATYARPSPPSSPPTALAPLPMPGSASPHALRQARSAAGRNTVSRMALRAEARVPSWSRNAAPAARSPGSMALLYHQPVLARLQAPPAERPSPPAQSRATSLPAGGDGAQVGASAAVGCVEEIAPSRILPAARSAPSETLIVITNGLRVAPLAAPPPPPFALAPCPRLPGAPPLLPGPAVLESARLDEASTPGIMPGAEATGHFEAEGILDSGSSAGNTAAPRPRTLTSVLQSSEISEAAREAAGLAVMRPGGPAAPYRSHVLAATPGFGPHDSAASTATRGAAAAEDGLEGIESAGDFLLRAVRSERMASDDGESPSAPHAAARSPAMQSEVPIHAGASSAPPSAGPVPLLDSGWGAGSAGEGAGRREAALRGTLASHDFATALGDSRILEEDGDEEDAEEEGEEDGEEEDADEDADEDEDDTEGAVRNAALERERLCKAAAGEEGESCSICMDALLQVRIGACRHALCTRCAYQLCARGLAPPLCPFCRGPITGFVSVARSAAVCSAS